MPIWVEFIINKTFISWILSLHSKKELNVRKKKRKIWYLEK